MFPHVLSPTFGEHITHLRLDATEWDRIFVVGDVHGCFDELIELLQNLSVTYSDLVVFTGDLVKKGPDSKRVVDLVRGVPNMFSVRGNNENKVHKKKKSKRKKWAKKAGLTENDSDWLLSLPEAISFGENIVVHGGINPNKELTDQTVLELQKMRSLKKNKKTKNVEPYWYEEYANQYRVFFGHTVMKDGPLLTDKAVGLDTGCVYGGELSAYEVTADTIHTINSHH